MALQFWEGDKKKAGELARLLADLERTKNHRVDLLLSGRWDCRPDREVAEYCGKAFNVYLTQGQTQLTGHPMGSWGLWRDTVHFVRDASAKGRLPRYDCILTFEADCVPMRRGWADQLLDQWVPGIAAMGHEILPPATPNPHVNGNLLISGSAEHLDAICQFECPPRWAWDLAIYPLVKRLGHVQAPGIRSGIFKGVCRRWVEEAIADGVAVVHGDKDGSVLDCAKSVLLGTPYVPGACDSTGLFILPDTVLPAESTSLGYPEDTNAILQPGGLIPDGDGGFWMAGLRKHLYRLGEHSVRLLRLSKGFEIVEDRPVSGLWTHPGARRTTVFSHPSLLEHDGDVYLAYGTETYSPAWSAVQHLAQLDLAEAKVRRSVDLSWVPGNHDNVRREVKAAPKDWQFFSDRGGIYFVQQLAPFSVGDVSRQRLLVQRSNPMMGRAAPIDGPTACTPPVRVGPNEWIGFFRERVKRGEGFEAGQVGAYTYNWDGEMYVQRKHSQIPSLEASGATGFRWPRAARYYEWPEIVPAAAISKPEGYVLLCTVNDSLAVKFHLPKEKLVESFSAPPILSARPKPRLPLRDGPK